MLSSNHNGWSVVAEQPIGSAYDPLVRTVVLFTAGPSIESAVIAIFTAG